MEQQSTAIILARATELRLKIRSSVNTATTTSSAVTSRDDRFSVDENNGVVVSRRSEADASAGEVEEDEEAVRLLNICDALESLENQLSSLQALQQRQRYEKEVALSEIEQSRKILLDKLKKYKGGDLEVIHEASVFVGETVQHNQDLMLPPYPSHLGNGYLHPFPSGHKSVSNGLIDATTNKATDELHESERKQSKSDSWNSKNGLGPFISIAAKSVVTIVGIVSILHLTGFRPKFIGKVAALKVFDVFRQSAAGNNGSHNECPPGKFLVMEGEEARCIVKERIEVPFSSVVAKPDVNYGSG
ncbi:plastid division protein PDV2-like [Benincasa hispida]|uniref:plastid division protein PDV2-like n=1 Tax=Benincasa hispida TaxID=102211 RepID=UPI0018FFD99F|nr:plastid division protein PDV2-like [Benincasa hispida]